MVRNKKKEYKRERGMRDKKGGGMRMVGGRTKRKKKKQMGKVLQIFVWSPNEPIELRFT